MQTKTYFASSVSAAMDVARRELGPEAMLVTSRPAPEDVRAFGRLEVTFAWEPGAAAVPAASFDRLQAVEKPQTRGQGGLEEIRAEMSQLSFVSPSHLMAGRADSDVETASSMLRPIST